MGDIVFEDKTIWRSWVTPKLLRSAPVHRWLVFPHSYSAELVYEVIDDWDLGPNDRLLDPFAGAGTTIRAAKEKGVPATGYDLMPFSVMVSRVKVANYDPVRLRKGRDTLEDLSRTKSTSLGVSREYPDLVRKAFPDEVLTSLDRLATLIAQVDATDDERAFYRLALLAVLPQFSRVVATGGWLKLVTPKKGLDAIHQSFLDRLDLMIGDVERDHSGAARSWSVSECDARSLPDDSYTYSAVLTSPPYPNRHDYTRVFGVELMFDFLDWEGTRKVRYQSIESHPEAKPQRPCYSDEYREPPELMAALSEIDAKGADTRIPRMLSGYFLDMFLCLKEMARVSQVGAHIALVVGNAQYAGVAVMVDELLASIGEQAGLECERIQAVRYRGNSAQQMAEFGRIPSRESVITFRKR